MLLFLKTLPGSWLEPVEPCERCDTDTPCVARRPPKLWRFMAPAKPLPMDRTGYVDELTGDEVTCRELGADIEQIVFDETRNSTSLAFGSTLATAKWPRIALDVFLTFAWPAPS